MLSILIPAYNCDCTELVSALHSQCSACGVKFEILVADDRSTLPLPLQHNRELCVRLDGCALLEAARNMGRASIRNFLAEKAQFPFLLFLDADAEVCSPVFIKDYLAEAPHAEVVCGGLRHPRSCKKGEELRFRYEKRADATRTAAHRSREPWAKFTTFSFLIKRELFLSIRFESGITGYGYEDMLFGLELKRRGISIKHIDNPLIHTGLEQNTIFLDKTLTALETLSALTEKVGRDSTLNRHYQAIRNARLAWVPRLFWRLFNRAARLNLTGHRPSLTLFNIYKLAYFSHIMKKKG